MSKSLKTYDDKEFIQIWNSSKSISDVIRRIGRKRSGASFTSVKNRAIHLNLSREHFNTEMKFREKISLDDILVENSTYVSSSNLRERLIKEGLIESKCSAPFCPVPNPSLNPFTGEPIPLKLSLDHINGNNSDNRIENLRLLCLHCHGETDTWCGKNKQRLVLNGTAPKAGKVCRCGKEILSSSSSCARCENASRKSKFIFPSEEEIIEGVINLGYTGFAKTLGMTDNKLRHYMKVNNIPLVRKRKSG